MELGDHYRVIIFGLKLVFILTVLVSLCRGNVLIRPGKGIIALLCKPINASNKFKYISTERVGDNRGGVRVSYQRNQSQNKLTCLKQSCNNAKIAALLASATITSAIKIYVWNSQSDCPPFPNKIISFIIRGSFCLQ